MLIDIDPQGNSSSGLGVSDYKSTIYEVLIGAVETSSAITPTIVPNLYVIPADINLVGAEIEMVEFKEREHYLKKRIQELKESFDYIFIDCPPSLGFLTLNSLTASDSVLIPVQCEYFALEGLGQLLNTINLVKQYYNQDLQIEGVLLTMYDVRLRLSQQVADEIKRYFGEKVYKTIIYRNVKLSEAPGYGKPVLLYDAVSTGAKNYLSLASEMLGLLSDKVE